MTYDEKALLLAVARIVRERVNTRLGWRYEQADLDVINEALAPFDQIEAEPVNEVSDKPPGPPDPPGGKPPPMRAG